jgi:hypothetical protein
VGEEEDEPSNRVNFAPKKRRGVTTRRDVEDGSAAAELPPPGRGCAAAWQLRVRLDCPSGPRSK